MENNYLNEGINEMKNFKKLAKKYLIRSIIFFVLAVIVCGIESAVEKFCNFDSKILVLSLRIIAVCFLSEWLNLLVSRYFMLKRNVNFVDIESSEINSYQIDNQMLEAKNDDEKLIIAKYTKGKNVKNNNDIFATEMSDKYPVRILISNEKTKEVIQTSILTVIFATILIVASYFANNDFAVFISVLGFSLLVTCLRRMTGNFIIKKYQLKYIIMSKTEFTNKAVELLGNVSNENNHFVIADIKNYEENTDEILENIIATF